MELLCRARGVEKDGVGMKEKKINGRSDCLEKRSRSCNRTGKEKTTDAGYAAGEDGSTAGWRKVLLQERSTSGFTLMNAVAKT